MLLKKYNLTTVDIYFKQGRKFKIFGKTGLKYSKIVLKYWNYILNTLKSVLKYIWFGKGDLRQTIMYAAWPDNISLQSTSLPPKGFQKVLLISITICVSSYLIFFFSNASCMKISVTLNQDDLQPSITWQKERACTVLISEIPAPSPAIYINLLRQFSVVQTGRENE